MSAEESKKLIAQEVERVFAKRGWKTFAQAEIVTNLPVGTLQRLRKGLGKADTIIRFGIASGEPEAIWKRIAVGLSPDGQDDEQAQEEYERERRGEVERVADPAELELLRFYREVPPELRGLAGENAINALKGMRTAADIVRERREARTIGKRADREENPTKYDTGEGQVDGDTGDKAG